MLPDLESRLHQYAEDLDRAAPPVTLDEVIDLAAPTVTQAEVVASRFRWPGPRRVQWGWGIAAIAAAVVLIAIGAVAVVMLFAEEDEVTPVTQPVVTTVPVLRHPADLVPTGIHDLSEGPHYDQVVSDPSGAIWAGGSGHLARIDPGSGDVRVWTATDDQVFGAGIRALAPAHGGGVWILGESLRWFDGQRFRDVVEAPPQAGPVTGIVEAPDGSLFASGVGGVFRWDGLTWTELASGRPVAGAGVLTMGPAGDLWVGNVEVTSDGPVGRGISRFDGERWVTHTGGDAAVLAGYVRSIVALSDGSVWVGTDLGAAFYDGAEWVDHPVTDFGLDERVSAGRTRVAVGPDGTVWAATPVGDRGWGVASFDGEAWSVEDSANGLSSASVGNAVPVSTEAGVFIGTGVGLFQRVDGRWVQVLPPVGRAGLAEAPESTPLPPSGVRAMKNSGGSLWVWGFDSIWRYSAGEWSPYSAAGYTIDEGAYVYDSDLAYAFDTAWRIRYDVGVVYLEDDQWQAASGSPRDASSLAVDPDTGSLWVLDHEDLYRWDGREWAVVERLVGSDGSGQIVAAGDGSVWTLRWSGWWDPGLPGAPEWSILARYDDTAGAWEVVRPLGAVENAVIHTATAAPDGSVWVVLATWSEDWEERIFSDEGEQPPPAAEPPVNWVLAHGTADGDEWTMYDQDLPAGLPVSLAADDDAVWLAMEFRFAELPHGGVVRFDGETWTDVATSNATQVEVAPDGTIWALVDDTPQQLEP